MSQKNLVIIAVVALVAIIGVVAVVSMTSKPESKTQVSAPVASSTVKSVENNSMMSNKMMMSNSSMAKPNIDLKAGEKEMTPPANLPLPPDPGLPPIPDNEK
jgi:cell division protein YceG involved in septum cleavage